MREHAIFWCIFTVNLIANHRIKENCPEQTNNRIKCLLQFANQYAYTCT